MRLKLVFLSALILTVVATASSSQIWQEATVQPSKLEVMRNLGLDASRSEAPDLRLRRDGAGHQNGFLN